MTLLVQLGATGVMARGAAQPRAPRTSLESALPTGASGEQIFRLACATCHGDDGRGSAESVVGFSLPLENGHEFPDFTDCATSSVEPVADWAAVVARGGTIRALDRHMPAFGEALSAEQIESVLGYLKSLCGDRAWPSGDLNLPRPLFTEKAFPENESVWTSSFALAGRKHVGNELLYERRLGARAMYEVAVPIDLQQSASGTGWVRGLGDVEIAFKSALYHDVERGSIFSAGGAVVLPTGKETLGLGNGYTVFEPFAMWGQIVGSSGFLQLHAGLELPASSTRGRKEGFLRSALGYTVAQDQGAGRAWTPMVELLVAKPEGEPSEWDVVPQVQVSLSKLQHVLLNVGVRVPVTQRADRKPQVLTYLLWDWFDGGFFQFWK